MLDAATTEASAVPLVGKKYMSQLGGMANEAAASAVSSFARKQMEKMGWTEGKGLGKKEQGMATYVRVKKRVDASGIGGDAVKKEQRESQWWYNVYDKLADKIKIDADSDDEGAAKTKRKKKKKSKHEKRGKRSRDDASIGDSDSDSDSDSENATDKAAKAVDPHARFRIPTDEELFAATGGKLFGRRAYGSCTGKLKRDAMLVQGSVSSASAATSSTRSTSSSSEEGADENRDMNEDAEPSKKRKKRKTHHKRHKGKEQDAASD